MSCVPVRGCRIGEGRPKVILPIVERTEAAILEKAAAFSTLCADCVEWRVDLFDAAADPGAMVRCLAKLRVLLKETLLLVTLRTKEEGGSIPVSHEGTSVFSARFWIPIALTSLILSSSPQAQTFPYWFRTRTPPGSRSCAPATTSTRPRPKPNWSPGWWPCSRRGPTCPSWP